MARNVQSWLKNNAGTVAFGLMLLTFLGCGGGGGTSATATFVGRVFNVATGGPTNPQSSVSAGGSSVLTSSTDGSFQLPASSGATTIVVDSNSGSLGIWQFSVPAASGVTDVGDLWIGPQRVTVRGVVRDSTTGNAVAGAIVTFAGRTAISSGTGQFDLLEVAYSDATQTAFWGIVGTVRASGYFSTDFSTQPNLANAGVVNVGDLLITPTSDPNPPGPPYNIWGLVSAAGGPQGAIVRLKQGGNDVRVFNVGPDGRYLFFAQPGTYTISASKGAQSAPDQQVTLTQPNEVIRRDFQLQ